MKPFIHMLLIAAAFNSCTNRTGNNAEQRLRTENLQLRQQVDSLKNLLNRSAGATEADTLLKLPVDAPDSPVKGSFTGKHQITLQWIGWDRPGSVTIVPSVNGWFTISGQQRNNQGHLKINGRIRPVSETELEFDGEIETSVLSISNGEPCLKTGKRIFKATGDRQYWRLQDMLNCDSSTTDYIDIYF